MNKVMALIAIVFGLVLAACQTDTDLKPELAVSADEKSALTIKPVEGAQLTQTEAEYRYRFARICIRPWSQFNAEFAKIAQGTRYASRFKDASQEYAKLCAERPQNAQAKNEWNKRTEKLSQRTTKNSFSPFLRNASIRKISEVSRINSCSKEIRVWMKEVAQLGANQNPSHAVRINRLYENMVRDQKKVCKDTSSGRRFERATYNLWKNRSEPLIRAVTNAIGI